MVHSQILPAVPVMTFIVLFSFFFFFFMFWRQLLYHIVLVLPYTDMDPPRVYICFLIQNHTLLWLPCLLSFLESRKFLSLSLIIYKMVFFENTKPGVLQNAPPVGFIQCLPMFPWTSGKMAEVMLCPFQCITLRGTNCQLIPLWVIVTLITRETVIPSYRAPFPPYR